MGARNREDQKAMNKIDAARDATDDAEGHIQQAMDLIDTVKFNDEEIYLDPGKRLQDLALAIEEIKKAIEIIVRTSWPTMLDYAAEQKP
jgi:hypothetical protein